MEHGTMMGDKLFITIYQSKGVKRSKSTLIINNSPDIGGPRLTLRFYQVVKFEIPLICYCTTFLVGSRKKNMVCNGKKKGDLIFGCSQNIFIAFYGSLRKGLHTHHHFQANFEHVFHFNLHTVTFRIELMELRQKSAEPLC